MSYRCAVDALLARLASVEPGGPWVACDVCGKRITIASGRRPPHWLLNGKAPPGWRSIAHEDGTRSDWCSSCKETKT